MIHSYLTDLDLAVVLGHLMNNAIDGARKAHEGFISIAYFDEEGCQSFIVESAISDEKALLSMMASQIPINGGRRYKCCSRYLGTLSEYILLCSKSET